MIPERVVIEELLMRLPGLTAVEARAVAIEVAERVGRGLVVALPRRALGALDVRLAVPEHASRDQMVDAAARSILEALGR